MEWKIGNIVIKNQVVMAPMAGISNASYMKIISSMGAGLVYTELVSAEAIIRCNNKTFEMLKGIEDMDIPVAIQIFGENEDSIALAAKIISEKYANCFIDINMGCPVPKVALRAQSGSALLKDPEKVRKIVSSVVKSVNCPVTVKIRSGWDENSINATKIAKIIEEAGASAIAIHARTRSQGYSGKANWDIIKKVVNVVSIPVIGNGDILSCYDAKRMLKETGCKAIMIGRGLIGNPWLIKECVQYLESSKKPELVSLEEKIKMMKKHLQFLYYDKNEKEATLELRSMLMYYLKGMPNTHDTKLAICKSNSKEEYLKIIDNYYNLVNDK